jgi:two-component sensor histidine kinase
VRYTARFPAVGESVVEARKFVTDSIVHVPRDVSDALMVIASELATNCIRHGATAFEIRIDQLPDRILIETEDDGDGEPVMRTPAPTDTSGRGLQIVKALADNWGVVKGAASRGKTVWAVLAIPASTEIVAGSEAVHATETEKNPLAPSVKGITKAVRVFLRSVVSPALA